MKKNFYTFKMSAYRENTTTAKTGSPIYLSRIFLFSVFLLSERLAYLYWLSYKALPKLNSTRFYYHY